MGFKLEYILPNPWQPRLSEDPEHIKQLALSIHRDGMMQIPVGRLVDANEQPCELNEAYQQAGAHDSAQELWDEILGVMGCRIQLAFGHSRLAAYQWLRDVKDWSDLRGDWSRMPVTLRDLDDETMARMAIEENVQRKDLNAIEEGMAMLRLRNEFQMTAEKIGEIFGLADSSVRNKMRLLDLPPAAQDALKRGLMSEGAARELLRFYELGEEVRHKATVRVPGTLWNTMSAADGAIGGTVTASELHELINRSIQGEGKNLHEAPWKWEMDFDMALDGAICASRCKGCSRQMEVDKRTYCVETSCYFAKRRLWMKARLAEASAVCGIRPVDELVHTGIQVDAEVRESGCANLRVVYRKATLDREKAALVPGFDDCMIVCGNRNGICTCTNGLAAKRVAEERVQQAREALERIRPGGGVSAETKEVVAHILGQDAQEVKQAEPEKSRPTSVELREAAREGKRKYQQDLQELQSMREEFARRIRDAAIYDHNRFAWHVLMGGGRWEIRNPRKGQEIGSAEEIAYRAALRVAEQETTIYSNQLNLGTELRELNELLKGMGLREITATEEAQPEPVYVPVEDAMEMVQAAPKGKTLMDVFGEQQGFNVGGALPGQKPGETLAEYWQRTDPSFAQQEEVE